MIRKQDAKVWYYKRNTKCTLGNNNTNTNNNHFRKFMFNESIAKSIYNMRQMIIMQ